MELQKLRYFHTVATFRHVTRAAESISIAQPALTQAIRSLENELGVQLLRKRGRNIELTEYGEYLKARLDRLLPELDAIPAELSRMKEESTDTVKMNILAASTFVLGAIVRYREAHPDVMFAFSQNEEKNECDIVITTDGSERVTREKPLRRYEKEEKIYLAVPRSSCHARERSIALASVRDEGFVMLSSSRLFGAICERLCASAGFYPRLLFASDSPTAVQNLISTGTGVAFWPEHSWGKLNNENVVLLPISDCDARRELIVELYERTPHSLHAEDFYRFLCDEIAG